MPIKILLKPDMSKLQFVKSAVRLEDFPQDDIPEVIMAGRSNAGKSSLINALAQSRIAKVSQVPGKTRLLNIFEHKIGFRLIDMPGYGFATRSKNEVGSWQKMIEPYLFQRRNLCGMLLVMDIRRDWEQEEQQLLDLAQSERMGFGLLLNKADKLSRGAALQKQKQVQKEQSLNDCLLLSVLKKQGLQDLEKLLLKWTKNC